MLYRSTVMLPAFVLQLHFTVTSPNLLQINAGSETGHGRQDREMNAPRSESPSHILPWLRFGPLTDKADHVGHENPVKVLGHSIMPFSH